MKPITSRNCAWTFGWSPNQTSVFSPGILRQLRWSNYYHHASISVRCKMPLHFTTRKFEKVGQFFRKVHGMFTNEHLMAMTLKHLPPYNTIKLSKRDEQNVNFTEKHLTKQGYFYIKRAQQSWQFIKLPQKNRFTKLRLNGNWNIFHVLES